MSTLRRAATVLASTAALTAGAVPAVHASEPPAVGIGAMIGIEHLDQAEAWTSITAGQPGERFRVLISYTNTSPSIERDVTATLALPGKTVLDGTSTLTNALHPSGKSMPRAHLAKKGVNLGDYGGHSNGYLVTFIRMPNLRYVRCGVTSLAVTLTERSGSDHASATLILHVHRDCPTAMTPVAPPG